MDDWHKSPLGWLEFDSMVDPEFSCLSKKMTTSLDLISATIVQRHQSGLFQYAFGPMFLNW